MTTARDRQSIVVQADLRRRHHPRRDRGGDPHAGRSPAGPPRGARPLPVGRRRDDARGRLRRTDGQGAGQGGAGDRSGPAELSARRDAGLHAVRLQHRQLSRCRAGQGRLPHLALRLRPRGRPLPPDPRDDRPPRQPGRPLRQHAAREGDRRRAAHRRQAVRVEQRAVPDDPRLDRGRRPQRRRRQAPQGRRRRPLSQVGRPRRQGGDPAAHPPGPVLRRHRPRRHQPGRVPDQ